MRKTLLEHIASLLGSSCAATNEEVLGYAIDSRKVQEGDLFFAIKGNNHDGHDFLREIAQKGAIGAVVLSSYQGLNYGLTLFYVDDVADALRLLAKELLQQHPCFVIGITGSVGKTTTKDFLVTLLQGKYAVHFPEGSYNSKLTLPLVVLNRKETDQVLVLEMGVSEEGDMMRLVQVAPPDLAIITKIGLSHVANFPHGKEDVAKEKGQIALHPKTKHLIFDQSFAPFAQNVSCHKLQSNPEEVALLRPLFPFAWEHLWQNFVVAYQAALHMGLEHRLILQQMHKLKLPKMRCEQIEKEGVHFFLDAYNANPESMRAALNAFSDFPCEGKKIAVLGSMKELGTFCEKEHRKVGRRAFEVVDVLFVLGREAYPLYETFLEDNPHGFYFEDPKNLVEQLAKVLQTGDAVLIKGSRSMQMEQIITLLDEKKSCSFGF